MQKTKRYTATRFRKGSFITNLSNKKNQAAIPIWQLCFTEKKALYKEP